MLFCLASGDFDLSVASVIACAGVTTAVVINLTESLWIGVAAGLLLGILCGLVNGFVIAKLKINALITTLATMQIVRGLAYIISDGKAVGIEDESFFALGYANWFGLPAPIWLTVACLIIFGLLLNKTTFGRNTLAIGGNEEAARLAGVPVVRTKIIIFVLSPGSPPSLFLLCCAERALQTCKYRQCDGGRHLQRRTANRCGGWLWWEKTLNCCGKKHQTVRFAFCL